MAKTKTYVELKKNAPVHLHRLPTQIKSLPDVEYKEQLGRDHESLEELQELLYAEHERALLIIFQGMDSSGKDGAIKHILSGVNPQGCSVVSFKTPSQTELDHDFLWRSHRALPRRGEIGIFNRSYYEETLITRVHPELLKAEHLPNRKRRKISTKSSGKPLTDDKKLWKRRFTEINSFEAYLVNQGFVIIKFFLHISKREQKLRLLERIRDPKKQWKISEGDVTERSYWEQYQKAYEDCLRSTSTKDVPWYVIPADDKKAARLMIADVIVRRLRAMDLKYPKLSPKDQTRLNKLKRDLDVD